MNAAPKFTQRKVMAGDVVLGVVIAYPGGYRFIPHTDAHKPSRKLWSTPEGCVPKWAIDTQARANAPKPASLSGRLNALSHRFAYDSAEARLCTEAAAALAKVSP